MLLGTTAGLAAFHTVVGVDHYVPFAVLRRAYGWSRGKMLSVTLLCGLGHCLSSVVLAWASVWLAREATAFDALQELRGTLASWLMVAFGVALALYGVRAARQGHRHSHVHVHADGEAHVHEHDHHEAHAHAHGAPQLSAGAVRTGPPAASAAGPDRGRNHRRATFWWLFVIFVLGPCESLIPLSVFAAARHGMDGALIVTLVFTGITTATMLVMTTLAAAGYGRLRAPWIERYGVALSGLVIVLAGALTMVGL